jgi:E3 ubiquitin-protein ligase CBL
MYHELVAEFPNYTFVVEYKFTKSQAASFWKENFNDRTTVPWNEFRQAISMLNEELIHRNTLNLKNTVDLTRSDNISNYEFDIFTRLFTPWDRLIDVWHILTMHPAYAVFMTYEEIMEKLKQKKPGSYLFRMSATNMGNWAVGYISSDGKAYQTIPKNKSMIEALVEGVRGKL